MLQFLAHFFLGFSRKWIFEAERRCRDGLANGVLRLPASHPARNRIEPIPLAFLLVFFFGVRHAIAPTAGSSRQVKPLLVPKNPSESRMKGPGSGNVCLFRYSQGFRNIRPFRQFDITGRDRNNKRPWQLFSGLSVLNGWIDPKCHRL